MRRRLGLYQIGYLLEAVLVVHLHAAFRAEREHHPPHELLAVARRGSHPAPGGPSGWVLSSAYEIFSPPIWELAPPLDMSFLAGILTISDKGAAGERDDTSGAEIRRLLSGLAVSGEGQ